MSGTEHGWLPDCVYTGEKFESGLAFFADALGRITRFSREPADLAAARRLAGQAALPGLVNAHSVAPARLQRGRGDERALPPLTADDAYDAARLAFVEMLGAGITCVGEFCSGEGGESLLRAAHDVGIRIALFVREADAPRLIEQRSYPADEAWIGLALPDSAALSPDQLKVAGAFAHAQRLRVHARLGDAAGKPVLGRLAEHGLVDKRFTAIGAAAWTDEDIKVLGAARAMAAVCPTTARHFGWPVPPVEKLLAANVAVAVGSGRQVATDLLEEARLLPFAARAAGTALHAATVAGARSLGATGGALEVGRPADFFTVNLLDPSVAGADLGALPANLVVSLRHRAIHEVWVGAKQVIANGRHANQGAIVGKFADLQRRIWSH